MNPKIALLGAAFLCILLGVFQIKRKDTDFFLEFCGCMDIACGAVLIIGSVFTWRCW